MVVFLFIQILKEHGGDTDQTPHSGASDLGLHCLPTCPTKRMLGFYGLRVGSNMETTQTMYVSSVSCKIVSRQNIYFSV